MTAFSKLADQLFDQYQDYEQAIAKKRSSANINVNEAIGTAAFLYERLRTVVDYKDEHILKKDSVKRILMRRFRSDMNPRKTARLLLRELVRSRYLPNNKVPEDEVLRVSESLSKYLFIYQYILDSKLVHKPSAIREWLLQVAAAEVDDIISVKIREDALVQIMYAKIVDKISISQRAADEYTRKLQIYIAIHKALVKSDEDIIRYNLVKLYYPDWKQPSQESLERFSQSIENVIKAIEDQLDHRLKHRLLNIVRKYTPPFLILKDVIEKNPSKARELLSDLPQSRQMPHGFDAPVRISFDEYLEKIIKAKYSEMRNRVRRRSFRAVIYILLTKVALTVIFEIPYDLLISGEINQIVLAINLLFHPLFVLVLAFLVRPPGKRNTLGIIQGIKEILFDGTPEKIYAQKKLTISKRGTLSRFVFTLLYAALFLISFGLIVIVLNRLGFNIVSGGIFIILFSTVSFFGVALRYQMKEFIVARIRENFLSFAFDLFTLPIIMAGRWLSVNFSRVNVFVFILDVIIEAPFQTLIDVGEKWIAYIREKRDEIM